MKSFHGPLIAATTLLLCSLHASAGEIERTIEAIGKAPGAVTRDAKGQVVAVDLSLDRAPVDEAVAQAALRLPDLKSFRLSLNALAPETFALLTAQRQLTELSLRDVPLTDAQFAKLLAGRTSLRRLALRRVNGLTDAAFDALAGAPRLEVLSLVEMSISGKGLARLAAIPRLRSLDVRMCDALHTADYRLLCAAKSLQELKISDASANDAAMQIIAAMPSIESLVIDDASVSGAGIQRLAENAAMAGRMRSLAFTRCHAVNDEALRVAEAMPRLETLSVRECPVSGEFLTRLAEGPADRIPKLKTLAVCDAFLSDKTLDVLPRFASTLRRLNLSRVALSPHAVKQIAKLGELESLQLAECSLDDESVRPISNLKKLAVLDLSGNFGVTDASVEALRALPRLVRLDVEGTGATSLK